MQRTERSYSTFKVRRGGCEKIPLIQGKEQWLRFAGAAVKRYPTPKLKGGGRLELPHVQGKKQQLRFTGPALKRYPTSKVRETQVRQ